MRTVRRPARVTPRTQDAICAMSAVCVCTSSVAGRSMAGGRMLLAFSVARRAAFLICSRAASGCRFTAANLVSDPFVTTLSASGQNGWASAIVYWSPVTSAIGTP
jgi:hypothetical protein